MERIFKVRFNTEFPANSEYPWRVIEIKESEWIEVLTQYVCINAFCESTEDKLVDGKIEYHITVRPFQIFFGRQNKDGEFEKISFY